MADEFGQRIQGLHQVGDTPVSTDRHIAVYALDDNGDYAYLTLDAAGLLKVTGGTEYQVDDAAENLVSIFQSWSHGPFVICRPSRLSRPLTTRPDSR